MKKRGILSWVLEFAGRKKSYYGGSVALAIAGVAASFIPYLLIADIVSQLINGNKDAGYYLKQVITFLQRYHMLRHLMYWAG